MHVLFLTEASSNMGIGHVTRCEAIAEAIAENWGTASFVIDMSEAFMTPAFNHICMNWKQNPEELQNVITIADAIVIDSYYIDEQLMEGLNSFNLPIFIIDDQAKYDIASNIIINPSVSAAITEYTKRIEANSYLGACYMPLRQEFWDMDAIPYHQRKGILISLGGSNMQTTLQQVTSALEGIEDQVTVLTSGYSINATNVIVVSEHQSAEQMREYIAKSRVIICAGGGTLLEAARCGTPAIVVKLADNQDTNISAWTRLGFAKYVGQAGELHLGKNILNALVKLRDHGIWRQASSVGTSLMDGQGARRIVKAILKHSYNQHPLHQSYTRDGLSIKNFIDCSSSEQQDILTARNNDIVRMNSINRHKLTLEHFQAFIKNLANSETSGYWCVAREGSMLGAFSLTAIDFDAKTAVLGYYKNQLCRSSGIGKILVDIAVNIAFELIGMRCIFAEAFEDNIASLKTLDKCGFQYIDTKTMEIFGEIKMVCSYELVKPANPQDKYD